MMGALRQPVWLKPEEVPPLPEGWHAMPTEDACIQLKPGKLFETKTVSKTGTVPVLNQSDTDFLGYHNEQPGVEASPEQPVVTFANHTCAMRLMKRPFSTIQNIFTKVGKPGVTDTTYFYYASLGRVGLSDYKGHHPIFRQTHIPLPPLPIQRRIASILSAYDDLIENSQRRIRILETMARALYREWFVHFRFPGHENHPRVASPLGEIPKGWEAIPFETLLASMTGGDWGSDQTTDTESAEVTIIRGTDFDEVAYGGQLRAPVRYIKPSSLKSRGLRPGDVIVENSINAKSRCIGTTLLADSRVLERIGRDAVAASFCKVFRLHDPRLAPLVHLHFRRLREDARMEYYQNVAANGIGNFQAQKFAKEERMILPKDEALRSKLLGGVAAIFESISVLSSKLSNLRRTRDLLLPRLLSGQVSLEGSNE